MKHGFLPALAHCALGQHNVSGTNVWGCMWWMLVLWSNTHHQSLCFASLTAAIIHLIASVVYSKIHRASRHSATVATRGGDDNTYRVCVIGGCGALNNSQAVQYILAANNMDAEVEVCIIKTYCRIPLRFTSIKKLIESKKYQWLCHGWK